MKSLYTNNRFFIFEIFQCYNEYEKESMTTRVGDISVKNSFNTPFLDKSENKIEIRDFSSKYSPFLSTASFKQNDELIKIVEESIYESEMIYESNYFQYKFMEKGEFILKAMNVPNVQIKINVKSDMSNITKSFTNSQMNLSFMSSHSVNSFALNTSNLMSYDHKMNQNRPLELINFLKQTPGPEFCNYFGVKSSLIKKYQILNKLFKKNKNKKNNQEEYDISKQLLNRQSLLDKIHLERETKPNTDQLTQKYLTLFRNRFC